MHCALSYSGNGDKMWATLIGSAFILPFYGFSFTTDGSQGPFHLIQHHVQHSWMVKASN